MAQSKEMVQNIKLFWTPSCSEKKESALNTIFQGEEIKPTGKTIEVKIGNEYQELPIFFVVRTGGYKYYFFDTRVQLTEPIKETKA